MTNPFRKDNFECSFAHNVFCTWDEEGKTGQRVYHGEDIVEMVVGGHVDEINVESVFGNLWDWKGGQNTAVRGRVWFLPEASLTRAKKGL